VYVDEAEWKWIELQAGGNMSQWCRERILSTEEVMPLEPEQVQVPRPAKTLSGVQAMTGEHRAVERTSAKSEWEALFNRRHPGKPLSYRCSSSTCGPCNHEVSE
jgi:hypothetical protein